MESGTLIFNLHSSIFFTLTLLYMSLLTETGFAAIMMGNKILSFQFWWGFRRYFGDCWMQNGNI